MICVSETQRPAFLPGAQARAASSALGALGLAGPGGSQGFSALAWFSSRMSGDPNSRPCRYTSSPWEGTRREQGQVSTSETLGGSQFSRELVRAGPEIKGFLPGSRAIGHHETSGQHGAGMGPPMSGGQNLLGGGASKDPAKAWLL